MLRDNKRNLQLLLPRILLLCSFCTELFLSSCQTPLSVLRLPQSQNTHETWPVYAVTPLNIEYERDWLWRPGHSHKWLRIENLAFKAYHLVLRHEERSFPEEEGSPYLEVSFVCKNPILLDEGYLLAQPIQRSRAKGIRWYVHNKNAQKLQLIFSPQPNRCELKITHPWQAWPEERWLVESLSEQHPLIQQITFQTQCRLPENDHPFWSTNAYLLSCPHAVKEIDEVQFLRDPIEAFDARFQALMGYQLPAAAIHKKDAEMPLDFSQAPRLQVIWLSSLNFTADFFGQILARILSYHAQQGEEIRLLLSQPTLFYKDRQLLDKWLSFYPNVNIYAFKFRYFGQNNPGTALDRLHRVNHIKILAATGYSRLGTPYGFVLSGGRNIRDSYLFRHKPDHQSFPWLIDYDKGESPFIFYDDFYIKITSPPMSNFFLSQLWKLFYHGPSYQRAPTFIQKSQVSSTPPTHHNPNFSYDSFSESSTWLRQLISVPYADDQALEQWLRSLFKQSEKEIWITTPYFRPPPRLEKALIDAAHRGLKVHILTRIELAGDDIPKIAEEVNKKTVNRYWKLFNIYEWTEPDSIMHAKLWLIDDELSIVSSINLNHRSFLHDLESAMIFKSSQFAKLFKPQIQKFFEQSRHVQSLKDIHPVAQWILQFYVSIFNFPYETNPESSYFF